MATQISYSPLVQHSLLGQSVGTCISDKLESLKGKKVVFTQEDKDMVPIEGWGLAHYEVCEKPVITIRQVKRPMAVAAVDSSCIVIADSEDGFVCAVKCGVAISYAGRVLMHFKIGPFLFYINEQALAESGIGDKMGRIVLTDPELATRFVRVRTERAIQLELSKSLTMSMVLVDGSLRSSQFEEREKCLGNIVENCALNANLLIGVSKSTKFKVIERISSLLSRVPGPACVEVTSIVKALVKNSVGDNVVVTFGIDRAPVLRADIIGDIEESLGLLLGNDQFEAGYPESLRLAHHLSTFSANEITCLKSYLVKKFGVAELPSRDLRASLLGSMHI